MDNYVVKLYASAYRDLDGIYTYIAEKLLEPGTALNMVDELEKAIFGLEQLPLELNTKDEERQSNHGLSFFVEDLNTSHSNLNLHRIISRQQNR